VFEAGLPAKIRSLRCGQLGPIRGLRRAAALSKPIRPIVSCGNPIAQADSPKDILPV